MFKSDVERILKPLDFWPKSLLGVAPGVPMFLNLSPEFEFEPTDPVSLIGNDLQSHH